jgi:hypothetical protein
VLEAAGYRLGNFTFFSEISYFRNLGLPERAPGLEHGREVGAFREWLGAAEPGQPFFAWVHFLEPHLPYGASGYRATEVQIPGSSGLEQSQLQATVPVGSAEFAPGDRDKLLELYDQDVERLDRVLGELLGAVHERGLEERTLVVFVADHGEELLEHGWVGHASTAIEAKLRPELLRIPLVLAGPGVEAGSEHHEIVQQVDVLPSVARVLGIDPPAPLDGVTLPGLTSPERPGAFARARAALGRMIRGEDNGRKFAFFDTSMGGNLTPVERVGERLQGITDGECLLESRLAPGAAEVSPPLVFPVAFPVAARPSRCEERRPALAAALASWREEHSQRRLELLRAQPASDAPGAEANAYREAIAVRRPLAEQEIAWSEAQGQITLEWESPASSFWVEYRVGRLPARVEGSFEVEQDRVIFGPFPPGFWNELAGYSPFRFRILDPAGRERSPWVTFRVAAAGPSARIAETDR